LQSNFSQLTGKRLQTVCADATKFNDKMDQLNSKMDLVLNKIRKLNNRIDTVEAKFDAFETKMSNSMINMKINVQN